jgi:uncharacterized protein YndB with AHSA1/START domain
MTSPTDLRQIRWRLHLASPPEKVYEFLATDAGRARFWAESAVEVTSSQGAMIDWRFPDGTVITTEVLNREPGKSFSLRYLGGSTVTFSLESDGTGGTDLTLSDLGVLPQWHAETQAGWVSVLLALKAAVDFNIDLRNHAPERNWEGGFVDN